MSMSSQPVAPAVSNGHEADVWRALASPIRRDLLDVLRTGPRTTGELAATRPDLSRFAVMQHLGVLEGAELVVVRRRGRHRINHLNPVPLRRWYERWVVPLADDLAGQLLALERRIQAEGVSEMAVATELDQVRTVRLEAELRFRASPERVFRALTQETLAWFPHTYGGDRVRQIVLEPRVGGSHYEDWGQGQGHLYGQVTVYDPPLAYSTRGRIMPGTLLDTAYTLEADGAETVLRMSKVAVGPMTEEEAASVRTFGDISRFADPLRALVEGGD